MIIQNFKLNAKVISLYHGEGEVTAISERNNEVFVKFKNNKKEVFTKSGIFKDDVYPSLFNIDNVHFFPEFNIDSIKTGSRIYSVQRGVGVVVNIDTDCFFCYFDSDQETWCYLSNGKINETDLAPSVVILN